MRQTPNSLTGEHTTVLINPLNRTKDSIKLGGAHSSVNTEEGWVYSYTVDFKKRFMNLLGYEFKRLPATLALNIIFPSVKSHASTTELVPDYSKLNAEKLKKELSIFDLKRLDSYSKNMVDFHLIIDLVPRLAKLYFFDEFKEVMRLSFMHSTILLGIGLQFKRVDDLQSDLNLRVSDILPQFIKIMKKFVRVFT